MRMSVFMRVIRLALFVGVVVIIKSVISACGIVFSVEAKSGGNK